MKINNSIGCSVEECRYHAKEQDYCLLEQIQVTKNAPEAKSKMETDCHSFESELQ